MNSYELSRNWFDFCFENPEKIKPNHSALYFFIIEHCNRLGWKKKFGLPTEMCKDAIGIKNYKTFINTLNDLIEWEFIELIEKSKNQYSSNIVAIVNFTKAHTKALTNATLKHSTKQAQSIVSIDKHNNIEQETIEHIYSLYPSKCPIKNSSTNKSPKHKDKIKTLLKSMTVEQLELSITTYINQCDNDKVWIKNFSTFLNNIPDCSEPENKKDQLFTVQYSNYDSPHEHTQEQIDIFKKNNEIITQIPCKN